MKSYLVGTAYVPEDLYFAYGSLVVFSEFILVQYFLILES